MVVWSGTPAAAGKVKRGPQAESSSYNRVVSISPEAAAAAAAAAARGEALSEVDGLKLHLTYLRKGGIRNATGYKSVFDRRATGYKGDVPYFAKVCKGNEQVRLGNFKTAVEAAVAYARHVGPPTDQQIAELQFAMAAARGDLAAAADASRRLQLAAAASGARPNASRPKPKRRRRRDESSEEEEEEEDDDDDERFLHHHL